MTAMNERGELRPWVIALVALTIMLIQVGYTAWTRSAVERTGTDAVTRAIHGHDTDSSAHDNLALLNAIDARQRKVMEDVAALKAVQAEQAARMDRMNAILMRAGK